MTIEQRILAVPGNDAEAFEYDLGGRRRSGWRTHILAEPHSTGRRAADALVESHWRDLHAHKVRLFEGNSMFRLGPGEYTDSWGEVTFDPADGPPPMPDFRDAPPSCLLIYALPDIETLDVIEFSQVGTHNASLRDTDSLLDDLVKLSSATLGGVPLKFAQMSALQPAKKARLAPWQEVREALANVMTIAPFTIQFADTASTNVISERKQPWMTPMIR